jgi:hypothetical protein
MAIMRLNLLKAACCLLWLQYVTTAAQLAFSRFQPNRGSSFGGIK